MKKIFKQKAELKVLSCIVIAQDEQENWTRVIKLLSNGVVVIVSYFNYSPEKLNWEIGIGGGFNAITALYKDLPAKDKERLKREKNEANTDFK